MNVSCISVTVSSRGSITRIGRQASPSAKATGTRRNIRRKNSPNRMSAACPDESTAPVMSVLPSNGPEIVEHLLAEKHQPRDARHRPGHVDEPQRQFRQLRDAVPGELVKLMPAHTNTSAAASTPRRPMQPHQGLPARRQPRPHVDLEMRGLAHADHGADHDRPDEQEARHLLGPDVGRDEGGVAREDLQADRDHQDGNGEGQQPRQQRGIAPA